MATEDPNFGKTPENDNNPVWYFVLFAVLVGVPLTLYMCGKQKSEQRQSQKEKSDLIQVSKTIKLGPGVNDIGTLVLPWKPPVFTVSASVDGKETREVKPGQLVCFAVFSEEKDLEVFWKYSAGKEGMKKTGQVVYFKAPLDEGAWRMYVLVMNPAAASSKIELQVKK